MSLEKVHAPAKTALNQCNIIEASVLFVPILFASQFASLDARERADKRRASSCKGTHLGGVLDGDVTEQGSGGSMSQGLLKSSQMQKGQMMNSESVAQLHALLR